MKHYPAGLDHILWQRNLSRREAWVWFLLLVLSPAALIGGILLQQKVTARIGLHIPATRQQAIEAARKYAISYGVHPDGWRTIMWVDVSPALATYEQRQSWARAEQLRKLAPAATLHVRFTSPDETRTMEVLLDPEARPTGFKRKQPTAMDAMPENDPASAQSLAEETMHDCMDERMPHMPMPAQPDVRRQANGQEVFTWEAHPQDFPELTFTYSASVRGLTLLDSKLTPKLDPKYEHSIGTIRWLKPALKTIGVVVSIILFLFVFVRYIQRMLQGEVSQGRMLLVSAVVGAVYVLFMVCGDQVAVQSSTANESVPFWVIVLFGGVVMLMLGAAAGVAYSGTEGDLRERYPSKLTSLDALILGRFTSRNVGSAVLAGTALAAWLLLLHGVIELAIGSAELGSDQLSLVQMIPFSRAPWAMILLSVPSSAIVFSTGGLLLPKMFSLRFVRDPRWAFGLFLFMAYIATCALSERTASERTVLLAAAMRLGAMALAFYTLDFLACLVLTGVLSAVVTSATLVEIAPGIQSHAYLAAGAVAVLLGSALYGVFRGKTVSDEQVRPLYAKNVAERLQLEEEIHATREAHARLLPLEPPKVPGVTLAATCQAADRVSGDFYDFFALAPHRVGLLLAEGGRGGLATALSIALAKGYVTQKARSGVPPGVLLQSLQATLGELMEGQADLGGVLYGVIDTVEQTLQYACLGASPHVLTVPDVGHGSEWTRKLGARRVLREGSVPLGPGARAILYTNGLASHVGGSLDYWLRMHLRRYAEADAQSIQKDLLHDLRTGSGTLSRQERSDITFVLLAAAQKQEQAQEQVA